MEQQIYFAGAHTSAGYRDLIESNLTGLKHIFLLEGSTSEQRSLYIQHFFEKWRSLGEKFELLLNSLNPDRFTGVINRRLGCAIIDYAEHSNYQPQALGERERIINLSKQFKHKNQQDHHNIIRLQQCKNKMIKHAHSAFKTGLDIHDDLEAIFINAMDFKKADLVAEQLIEEIFTDQTSRNDTVEQFHRFLGASTANGVVDYIDQLTEPLQKRYLIKGRAGSGKSTLLRKIVAEAEKRHYSTEIYHCGFDPDSLDMVIIRELGMAIFDSTAPHQYEPSRHADQLVDLYQTTISPGTDEKYQEQISQLTTQYRSFIQQGIKYLAEAVKSKTQLEAIENKYLEPNLATEQFDEFTDLVEKTLSDND